VPRGPTAASASARADYEQLEFVRVLRSPWSRPSRTPAGLIVPARASPPRPPGDPDFIGPPPPPAVLPGTSAAPAPPEPGGD
jgi:hypothetical protein